MTAGVTPAHWLMNETAMAGFRSFARLSPPLRSDEDRRAVEAGVAFDVDGNQARATRKRVLDEVATERTFIAGSHLEFPALGYVARDGAGYRFVPALWVAGEQQ